MKGPKEKKDVTPDDDDFFKPDPIYIPERKHREDFGDGMEENLPDLNSPDDDHGGGWGGTQTADGDE